MSTEPTAAKGKHEETSDNYTEKLTEIDGDSRELLVDYAKLPNDDSVLLDHVHRVRAKAWEKEPYGCVGLFAFMRPFIHKTPNYPDIQTRLSNGATFLDLGCGFGQNMRKLVVDGAPPANVYGADISQWLVDCGYDYFQDRESLACKFFIGDLLDASSEVSVQAKGSFDIVFATLVYHLWGWEKQVNACIATIQLLKPVAGSTLFGWQLGSSPAGEAIRKSDKPGRLDSILYHHDEESWRRMWKEIEAKTGTKWDVQVTVRQSEGYQQRKNVYHTNPDQKLHVIGFSMTRL